MANYSLDTIRHSTAHLMAHAICELYGQQDIQLGIGPTIEDGFYYDMLLEKKITEEDFPIIEAKMAEIIQQAHAVSRHEVSREKAIELFHQKGQTFKVEIIQELPAKETITYYQQGNFIDLCRGPHVENTKEIPTSFKLLSVAGAYWRGREDRPMLQRIYATAFFNRKELATHLQFIEEAKKKDHRRLGKDLELFVFDKHAPGSPFFLPKGAFLYNELMSYIRYLYKVFDYQEVITPQVMDADLWRTSGHYQNFYENMFFTSIEEREFALKPMNCPAHMVIFRHQVISYRDLPLRYADFGRLHRYEKSGTLAGLTRVRTFSQDDGHIFLGLEMVQEEITGLIKMYKTCYNHFGFSDVQINLSTRPEKRMGSDENWDFAENALKVALEANGCEFVVNEGDGAFYGPKIDFKVADALKRRHQLGTIQLDFQLPERFELRFTNAKGELERPVVIHRALLGSLERFMGIYIEHTGGAFPFWLAPEQARIIPVNCEHHLTAAKELALKLRQLDYRIRIDQRNESLNLKTRQTQMQKIPYMIVLGDKEIEQQSVSLRKYGEQKSVTLPIQELLALFANEQDKKRGL